MAVSDRQPRLDANVRRFLEAPDRYATLATLNADGSPHQTVVWYLVEDDGLVINSREGRRWPTNLQRDARASMTVEDAYDYVTLRGQVEPRGGPELGQADIAAMARRYKEPEEAEQMIQRTFRAQRRVSFLLRPRSVTVHGELD